MDCTCLVNRKYRLKRDDIPEFLVEPDILFDAPEGDCRRMLAFSQGGWQKKSIRAEEAGDAALWYFRLSVF